MRPTDWLTDQDLTLIEFCGKNKAEFDVFSEKNRADEKVDFLLENVTKLEQLNHEVGWPIARISFLATCITEMEGFWRRKSARKKKEQIPLHLVLILAPRATGRASGFPVFKTLRFP